MQRLGWEVTSQEMCFEGFDLPENNPGLLRGGGGAPLWGVFCGEKRPGGGGGGGGVPLCDRSETELT